MEKIYLNLLDRNARFLMQEIEESIGSEVKIKVDASRVNKLACEVDKFGDAILTPKPDYFPNDSVYHELLHIRRFCVYKVPRIVVCEDYNGWTPELDTILTSLDNDIEHFIIVPDELNQYANRKSYWKVKVECILDNFESLGLNIDDQERRVLINWAFVHHVFPCKELVKKANTAVNRLCITDRTPQFIKEIIQSLNRKESLVQIFFKNLRIPIEVGCLEYLDCMNKTSHEKPLKRA